MSESENCTKCIYCRKLEYDCRGTRELRYGWCCTMLDDTVMELKQPEKDMCEVFTPREDGGQDDMGGLHPHHTLDATPGAAEGGISMGVYIKGMEMPTSCRACMFSRTDIRNVDWCVLTEKDLPCDCPLVPVPPHGRLIDADALLSKYKGNIWTAQTDYAEGLRDVAKDIADAPTIIEAEEGAHKGGGPDETPAGPYDLLYEEGGYNSNGV